VGSEIATLPDLAGIRASKGISLQDIAYSTKITLRYLQAIERWEFDKLPGGVYNVNYIRQYARAVEIDERGLLDHYRKVLEETD
jgi:cytoskeletal protein RodZ